MRAQFSRASLLVLVDVDPKEDDEQYLHARGSDLDRGRCLLHETFHFWQQLSQGFLIRLADEEWQRLLKFEKVRAIAPGGPVQHAFFRRDARTGLSARILHEGLARFWELIAYDPSTIMVRTWNSRSVPVHPNFREAMRQARRQLAGPDGTWSSGDVALAMLMIGGEYAAPFLNAVAEPAIGQWAMFVFPWLAHFALQTDDPAASYTRLCAEAGGRLAEQANEIADQSKDSVAPFETVMLRMYSPARAAFEQVSEVAAVSALTMYRESRLVANPAYGWMFERLLRPAMQAMAGADGSRDTAQAANAAQRIEVAMATPGLPGSRASLLMGGLVPHFAYKNTQIASYQTWPGSNDELRTFVARTPGVLPPLMELPAKRDPLDDDFRVGLEWHTQKRWAAFLDAVTG